MVVENNTPAPRAGSGDAPDRSSPRVAIVTGGGSGIGRAVASALARDGWCVALAGRREVALQRVVDEAPRVGAMLAVPTDVTRQDSVAVLFERTVGHFGRVDLLFNNAGVSDPRGAFEDWTAAEWQRVLDTNLSGMFFGIQQAFRTMKQQSPRGGRIINNGSISATTPRPGSFAYTATKHAVEGLTKTASLDGRRHDIAVGQIDIGNARTDMLSGSSRGALQANGETVVEPLMDVEIVAQSVLYMANLPLEANVLFHTVMATKMPFVGRG